MERLRAATDDLTPSADFADAIMAAVEQERTSTGHESLAPVSGHGWWNRLARDGVAAVALASVAAAACLVLADRAESTFDQEVLASIDVVEVAE